MDQVIKHGLELAVGWDDKSQKRMRNAVRNVFTEEAHIDFANPENIQGLKVLGEMMRKIFTQAGEKKFDFEKIMGAKDASQMFAGLKDAAMEFDRVWESLIANMGSFSFKDMFMRDASELSMALQRISDKNRNIIKANIRDIQRAFEEITEQNHDKLFDKLLSAENAIKGARTWEARTAAALEYVRTYEKIIKITDGDVQALKVEPERMQYAERSLNKNNKVAGIYSVDALREAMPQMQTSLQNIFNMAMGKALIGLTDGGVIDINVSPVVINKLDLGDLFNKKVGSGGIEIPVVPEIDPNFEAKLTKLFELSKQKGKDAQEQFAQLQNEIVKDLPVEMQEAAIDRLYSFLETKGTNRAIQGVWKDFVGFGGTGAGAGGFPELERVEGTIEEKRNILEDLQQKVQQSLADQGTNMYRATQEELDKAKQVLAEYEKILVKTAGGKALALGTDMSNEDMFKFLGMDAQKAKGVELTRKVMAGGGIGSGIGGFDSSEVEDGIERATVRMRTYDEEIRRAHEHMIKLAKEGASIYDESYDPFDDPLASKDFFDDFKDQDGHIDQDELFSTLSRKFGDVEYMNADGYDGYIRLTQTLEMVDQIEKAYERLEEIDNPYEIKDEETLNKLYVERLDIIDRIGAANLKNYNRFKFDDIEKTNSYYRELLDDMKYASAEQAAEKSFDELDGLYDKISDTDDPDEANVYLEERKRILSEISPLVREDYEEAIEAEMQTNSLIEKRIALLRDAKAGRIDVDDIDEIIKESGDLESKLERLQDVSEDWGSKVKDSELDEDEDALEALQEFEETYDRIILKLANGRNIEILPNAKGLRALYKYYDGIDSGVYGETEIEDVEFVRKEMQQISQEVQRQAEVQVQANDAEIESNKEKIKSYEELSAAVSRYIELAKTLVDTEKNTKEHRQIEQDKNSVDEREKYESKDYYINAVNKQQRNISKIKSAIKNGSSSYIDDDGDEYRIVEDTLKEAESKLRAYIYYYARGFEDISALVDGAKTKSLKNIINKEVGKFKADEEIQRQQEEIAEAANAAALAEMERIEQTIEDSAPTEKFDEVFKTLGDLKYRAHQVDRHTQSVETDNLADAIGIISPHKAIKNNAKAIESYEELCRVVERYNELTKENYIYSGGKEHTPSEDEENEIAELQGRLNATREGVKITYREVSGNINKLAQLLGIEIPKAAQQAETAVAELNRELKTTEDNTDDIGNPLGDSSGADADTGQTDGATSDEVKNLNAVRDAVGQITANVKEKTQEFLNEQSAVKKVSDSEVHALGEVEKKVTAIRVALSNVNTLLNNIKKGNDISQLSDIKVTVNYPKQQDNYKQLVGEIKEAIGRPQEEKYDDDKDSQQVKNITDILTRIKIHTHNTVRQIRDNLIRKVDEKIPSIDSITKATYSVKIVNDGKDKQADKWALEDTLRNKTNELLGKIVTHSDTTKTNTKDTAKDSTLKQVLTSINTKVKSQSITFGPPPANQSATKPAITGAGGNLLKMYERLGALGVQKNALDLNSDERKGIKEKIRLLKEEIDKKKKLVTVDKQLIVEAQKKGAADQRAQMMTVQGHKSDIQDVKDEKKAISDLLAAYERLGTLRAKRDALPKGAERDELQKEIKLETSRLWKWSKKLGVDSAKTSEASALGEHRVQMDNLVTKTQLLGKYQKNILSMEKGSESYKNAQKRINELTAEIALIQKKITLTQEEKLELNELIKKNEELIEAKKSEQADKKTKADNAEATKELNKLTSDYEKLGKLRAKFEGSGDLKDREELRILAESVAERRKSMALTQDEITLLREKSAEEYKSELRLVEAAKKQKALDEQKKAAEKDSSSRAAKRAKELQSIASEYGKLGKLQAKFEGSRDLKDREELRVLAEEVAQKRESLKLTSEEILALRKKSKEAYKTEQRLISAAKEQKTLDDQKKAAEKKANDASKQTEREAKKQTAEAKRQAKRDAMFGKAGNAIGRAENLWMSAQGEDGLPKNLTAQVDELYDKLVALRKKQDEVRNAKTATPEQQKALRNQTIETNKLTNEVSELFAEYQRLSGVNVDETKTKATTLTNKSPLASYETELKQYVRSIEGEKAQIKGFNAETKTLTYTVKTGKHEFTEYTAAVRHADNALVSVQGATKRTETFFEATKRKMKELTSYMSGMAIFSRVTQEIRQGIQYIREIDLALTELKKVTDETEETYDKFLETAAKTADKVGSTIQKVVSSTADWARLGYSMKEAAEFAESTQILMNVSEFTDISTATDTLISAVQAFGYTAETSMEVVDLMNIIGNNYAISTADLATSLTKSSASLVAAGGDLAEAAALTATANAIIQDADSVGTALKTTSLRLRGTSVEELEKEGVDSDGAVESTSKLQSKIKALSGVDILTETGEYKSTYQILSQIADVWAEINDMDQAALLELLAGKRNASVLAAILQAPEQLEAAYKDAQNAEGSALKENERYLDSIQGKIDQFNNAMQAMWSNTLYSDWIKGFVELGTEIIKIIDDIGVLRLAIAGFITYVAQKWGGLNFAEMFSGLTSKGVNALFGKSVNKDIQSTTTQLEELERGVERAKQAYMDDGGSKASQKALQEAEDALATYKKLQEEGFEPTKKTKGYFGTEIQKIKDYKKDLQQVSDDIVQAEAKVKDAELSYQQYSNYAEFHGGDTSGISFYKKEVEAAKKEVEALRQKQDNLKKNGSGAFQSLADGANKLTKQIQSAVASMLVMYAISKAMQILGDVWDKATETAEEAKGSFEELSSELSQTESELSALESQLNDIKSQIEGINANTPLTFTDQEELLRLQAESAELQRQIDLLKTIKEQQAYDVNESAINAANKYAQTGVKTGKTTDENVGEKTGSGALIGAGIGVASGVGTAILGAKAGTALGAWAGPVGMLIGAAVGALAGGVIGAAVGGIESASEEKVGESLDDMREQYAQLQKEFNVARENYKNDASDKNKKKFEEAQEALKSYQSNMASYMSEMDTYYSRIKANWEHATTEQKQEYIEWADQMDTWAIQSGGTSAKSNAIARIFGDEASDELKEIKKRMEETTEAGEEISLADAFNGDEEAYNAFKTRLYDIGLTVYETEQYFKDQKKAADEAINSIETYDAIKQIQKLTGGVNDLKNAFKELHEEGLVSAETLLGLEDVFGDTDGWDEFFETMSSGTATMEEAEASAKTLAENYVDGLLSSGKYSAKEYVAYISHLQSLGITNAKDFLDAKLKKNMAMDIAQKVKSGTSESDAIEAVEKEYGIKLDGENDRLLVEKAITAEKAKQEALDKQAAKNAYDVAKTSYEVAIEKNQYIDEQMKDLDSANESTLISQFGVNKYYFGKDNEVRYKYNGNSYPSLNALKKAIAEDLKSQKVEVPELPIEVTDIDVTNANNAATEATNALQTELDKHGLELKINLIDKNELIDEAQSIYDTLANAAKEYGENGYVSVDTLQSLLQLEPKYLALLYDENGQLNLNKDTMYQLTVARVTDMGIQQAQQVIETARTALLDNNIEKLKELTTATDGQATSNWDLVKSNLALLKTEMTDKGVDDSIYAGIEDQVLAIQNLTNTTIANIGNTISSSGNTATAEVEDAFQNLMDYYDNRISANQAKYDQIQNDIDYLESQGKMADANYYKDQIALLTEGEESKEAFLEAKLQAAHKRVQELKAAGQEGSDEFWEAAKIYNDTLSELDDIRDTVLELQDAIGEIEWSKFEELNNRIDDVNSKLETMRDLIAPDGEEDWFDDEGNWTEKGIAVLGSYVQSFEYYKNGLNEATEALETFQSKEYNEANAKWFADNYGIHSEQEYYDYLQKLTDEQYKYASSVSDTKQDIAGMWESQVDAVEEYFETLIESYNDYIDSVKEALDAERDLYDFKKNVQKQSKGIAALERRIASLSGSTNASDIAERRKLEAELYDSRESLNDTYYDHSKQSQQEALEAESVAYEETMNRFVENLRTNLDTALQDVDTFIQGVTSAVTVNAPTILGVYNSLGIALDSAIVDPWQSAIDAMGDDGYSGEEGLGLMNSWVAEGGVFSTFSTKATNYLTSVWDDANVDPDDAFATAVSNKVSGIVNNIKQNVETAKGYLQDMYDVQDSSVYTGGSGGGGGDVPPSNPLPEYSQQVEHLQQILNQFFGANMNVNGIFGPTTRKWVKKMQETIGVLNNGVYNKQTYEALVAYLNKQPVGSWFRQVGFGIPEPMPQYAKGTTGTTRDEWALTDEPQFGDELVLVPGKDGNLSFMRKGTGVVPADMTQKLFELAQIPTSDLMNKNFTAIVPNITKNDFKNEFNFESLVHVDKVDSDTLPKLEKMVDKKIDDFSRALNYSLKKFAR
ncbi:MAG: phage tail tape measure protein [Paludibacteraceae bacterium]|nr:phage tail tape measure protein [Paludibacteraceae bacterium]